MEQLLEKQGDGEAGVNSEEGGAGGREPCPPNLFGPSPGPHTCGVQVLGRPGLPVAPPSGCRPRPDAPPKRPIG